jgi:hypothetical protein
VWIEVERFGKKVNLYSRCDRKISDTVEQEYKSLVKKVCIMVKEIGEEITTITKRQ